MITQIQNMLRIIDGELVCKDGSDVKEYLRNYAIERGMDEDTQKVLTSSCLIVLDRVEQYTYTHLPTNQGENK